jgi:hypothetical protein
MKMISEIQTNDMVRSGTRTDDIAMVRQVCVVEGAQVHELRVRHLRGADAPSIVASAEHLFWVDGKGWTTVARLKAGDWLSNEQGQPMEIVENKLLDKPRTVYTLGLEKDNAFYANDVLVHDLCGGALPVSEVAK